MAIEIRIESTWDSDDGEGRRVEVSLRGRSRPWDDPWEDSRWFAGGDIDKLKSYLCRQIDQHAELFSGRDERECERCRKVTSGAPPASQKRIFVCDRCGR